MQKPHAVKVKVTKILLDVEPPRLLPTSYCPGCNRKLNFAMPINKPITDTPSPGDLSLCACGEILMFNDILVAGRVPQKIWDNIPIKQRAFIEKASAEAKQRNRKP
jgi:hypothetical protein